MAMAREIKFRAKSLDGIWEYGDLHLSCNHPHIHNLIGAKIYIDHNTIGQFTGLHDKNGKEIYEGDIVGCVSWNEYFSKDGQPMEAFRRKMYIDFRNGGFKMIEPMPTQLEDHVWDIIYNGDIEVIGNIHDNPELLKED